MRTHVGRIAAIAATLALIAVAPAVHAEDAKPSKPKTVEGETSDYLVVTLSDASVVSYQLGGDGDGEPKTGTTTLSRQGFSAN